MKKYCPLSDYYILCEGKDCAWYDGKQCVILSIMKALESIANSISNGAKR